MGSLDFLKKIYHEMRRVVVHAQRFVFLTNGELVFFAASLFLLVMLIASDKSLVCLSYNYKQYDELNEYYGDYSDYEIFGAYLSNGKTKSIQSEKLSKQSNLSLIHI